MGGMLTSLVFTAVYGRDVVSDIDLIVDVTLKTIYHRAWEIFG